MADRYGLDAVTGGRRLAGGYANDVFLIETVQLRVVLHVKYPPVDLDSLTWEHRLLTALSDRMPEVAGPVPARDGTTFFLHGDRPAWLTPYVSGAPAGPDDRIAVARSIARLHGTDLDMELRPGHPRLRDLPIPPVGELPPAFEPWIPRLDAARTEFIALVRRLDRTRTLTTGITHNDVFPGNVIVERSRVTALLDWEEADEDWLVWDLATALWAFCRRGDDLDPAGMADFLSGYRQGGGEVPSDLEELIVPLIRGKLILEVLRAPMDRDPRWDYQLANLRAYERLG